MILPQKLKHHKSLPMALPLELDSNLRGAGSGTWIEVWAEGFAGGG